MRGWTYVTPNPPTDALFVDLGDGKTTKFWAEDEEWLVCLDCHLLIENEDQAGLLSRSIRTQRRQMIIVGANSEFLHRQVAAEVARIHGLFWAHKSPVPPVPEPGYRA